MNSRGLNTGAYLHEMVQCLIILQMVAQEQALLKRSPHLQASMTLSSTGLVWMMASAQMHMDRL